MRRRINDIAALVGAASVLAAALIVGVGTSSYSENVTTVRNADATFVPSAAPDQGGERVVRATSQGRTTLRIQGHRRLLIGRGW